MNLPTLTEIVHSFTTWAIIHSSLWILFKVKHALDTEYEKKRDRREAIRKHYTEEHDVRLEECDINLCMTII